MVVAIRDVRSFELSPPNASIDPRPTRPLLNLVNHDPRPDVRSEREPALYGRDAELAILRAALAGAVAGHGRLVLVGGEAGIGKTALVQALAREAEAAGALVLAAGCDDLAPTPPFGPWIELVRSYSPTAELPPPPDGLANADVFDTPSGRDALCGQAIAFLTEAAAVRPVVLILEDQHWADGASLDLLRFVARRLSGLSALIVATYRDAELGADAPLAQALPRLAREGTPLRLDLRRLDVEAVRRLVADRYDLAPADEARLVDHLQRNAEGNPFYLGELLRALEQDGVLAPADSGTWALGTLTGVQVPLLIRRLVAVQADRLGEAPRKLLQLAAVIGTLVPLDLWGAVAGVPEDELVDAVEAALGARLLVETPDRDGLRFRHTLIREALYEEVVLPRRRAWHRRVAEALIARAAPDPDAVAHHFALAGDARAAAWLVEAGHRAARRDATRDAIERYEAALERFPEDSASAVERGWLLWELAEAHRFADPRRALDYLSEAEWVGAATGNPGLATMVRWTGARLRSFLGESAFDELRAIVDAFERLPAADRARAVETGSHTAPGRGILAQWAGLHGRYQAAIEAADAALRDDESRATTRDLSAAAAAFVGRGLAFAATGRPREARDALAQAQRRFRAIGNRFMSSWTVRWALTDVALPYAADDPASRRELATEYARFFDEMDGLPTDREGRTLVPLYVLDLIEGDWERAETIATAFLGVNAWRIDALATLGELARLRGKPEAARARLREGLPDGPASAPDGIPFVRRLALLRLGAELALDAGRPEEALPWLAAHDRWLDWSGRTVERPTALLLWARHALLGGETDRAVAFAQEALAGAREPRQPLVELATLRFVGELSTTAGDLASAGRQLAESVALADACAAPYERALTLLARAELRVATGDSGGASADLVDARAILEPLGAPPALERAAAVEAGLSGGEIEAANDILGSVTSAPTMEPALAPRRAGFGGLSPRELEVLRLVARGLTDAEVGARLFISPRTVARHLQSVYNKLAVNSRTAAAALAYEHGLLRGD